MLIHVYSAKCVGIDAVSVTVEVEITHGIGIHMVGLADVAVKESLLRTTTALQSLGFKIPGRKIVINLAPADVHKKGSGYDLPIAVGIIAASEPGRLPGAEEYLMMGELGLDGEVRSIPGALSIAELAANSSLKGVILPEESALEAMELEGVDIYGVKDLHDVVRILEDKQDRSDLLIRSKAHLLRETAPQIYASPSREIMDFSEIAGQEGAKRGVEIAASGGHNLLFVGSPGSGKSSLAKAMAGILPPMSRQEALVTSKIYSIAGKGSLRGGLVRQRPFRSPHYSASLAAIIGGGADTIIPGEVSLAQNGILFLDEVGQMPKSVVEALRAPLEDREVTISRLKSKVSFPASFMLVAASNPCPCGYWGDGDRCNCTPTQRLNYIGRLSGPIMDRIDLHIWMSRVPSSSLLKERNAEPTAIVAERVRNAREIQSNRFKGLGISTNAEMSNKQIEQFCHLDDECRETMEKLMNSMCLSMRAYFRIIKVARTIADLAGSENIKPEHLLEASGYRFLDRQNIF